MSKITIVDAPCGAGKTTWGIQEMNTNPDKPYLYVTPFLSEITRIRESCHGFQEPLPYGQSKLDSFHELLSKGVNIATTHSTFLNATDETLELIRESGYTLILDEVLDVIQNFNDIQPVEQSGGRQAMKPADVQLLLDQGLIQLDNHLRVSWCGKEYGTDSKFAEVERFAKLGRLYCVRGTLLLAVFPPEMFALFDGVYVLTYLFQGSLFQSYFRLFGIPYEMASVQKGEDAYSITPYSLDADITFRQRCKELITICDDPALNAPRRTLSKSWYQHAKPEALEALRSDIRSYFRSHAKSKAKNAMWTCPTDYQKKLSGKGYSRVCQPKQEWKLLPVSQREQLEKSSLCFVPCNAKATNLYGDRWALAYALNMFHNPLLHAFFQDCGEDEPDDDTFALSCLIQWISRSRLRNGLPVMIYLPSKRMRNILLDFMCQKT